MLSSDSGGIDRNGTDILLRAELTPLRTACLNPNPDLGDPRAVEDSVEEGQGGVLILEADASDPRCPRLVLGVGTVSPEAGDPVVELTERLPDRKNRLTRTLNF